MTDLQANIGRNVHEVEKELKEQGYTVHLVRTGPFATGGVPLARDDEKRVVLTFNGSDNKITYIREGVREGEKISDHANMRYPGH